MPAMTVFGKWGGADVQGRISYILRSQLCPLRRRETRFAASCVQTNKIITPAASMTESVKHRSSVRPNVCPSVSLSVPPFYNVNLVVIN